MKRIIFHFLTCLLVFASSLAFASSDFEVFIRKLNVEAQADLGAFKARLAAQFGVSVKRVESIMAVVENPGDAYICFHLGRIISKPVEVVLQEYQTYKSHGWGVIAKNLGIKPGSKEFHNLKKGNFGWDYWEPSKSKGKGKGRAKL